MKKTVKKEKGKTSIDLMQYNYPNPTGADIAFPTYDTIPELLEEAQRRGFDNHYNPYVQLFSDLFFNGGEVVFKRGINEEKQKEIWVYVRSFMGSWAPKHEHKEAICAMLMSEILEPNLEKL